MGRGAVETSGRVPDPRARRFRHRRRALLVVATTPYHAEPPELLAESAASLPAGVPLLWQYPAELGVEYPNESALRRPGLDFALETGARWWLQLDADEILVRGEELLDRLELEQRTAYPLPRLEENGAVQLCPYKLVRLPVSLVLGCDHFRRPGDPRVWRYSLDRTAAEHERGRLLAGPHLVHRPSRRPPSRPVPRIGELENVAEPRPDVVVVWPGDSPLDPWRS